MNRDANRPVPPAELALAAEAAVETGNAIDQLHDNFEVRRLLLVCLHLLIPALLLFVIALLGQRTTLPALSWLQRHALTAGALIGCLSCAAIALTLARTHVGITSQGAAVGSALYAMPTARGLNFSGVSTNVFLLLGVSAVSMAWLLVWSLVEAIPSTAGWLGLIAMACLILVSSLGAFEGHHAGAVASVAEPADTVPADAAALENRHRKTSVGDTTLDIVVVATMAVTMFAALVNAIAGLGSIAAPGLSERRMTAIGTDGIWCLSLYGLLVMTLSQRILLRLRVALGEHATELRRPRHRRRMVASRSAWTFSWWERTFVLYTLVGLFACLFLVLALGGAGLKQFAVLAVLAVAYLAAATWHYRRTLARETKKYHRTRMRSRRTLARRVHNAG